MDYGLIYRCHCARNVQEILLFVTRSRCTYEHSGIDETHISFETNCLLHLNISAFSGIRYDLVLILNPLPQVTEQLDQAVYSVVWHSAENNKQNDVE